MILCNFGGIITTIKDVFRVFFKKHGEERKMQRTQKLQIEKLVFGAVMTAFVIIFQLLASFTAFFGPFSTAAALIPIVIGAAICGVGIGGWLGLVFGTVVLVSGGAAFFMTYSPFGTIFTVLLKGLACGLAAGAAYKLLSKVNEWLAVIAASLLCPVVNTGVFLLGCAAFFLPYAEEMAAIVSPGVSGMTVFWVMAMANFLIEIATNLVLCPIVVRLLKIKKQKS